MLIDFLKTDFEYKNECGSLIQLVHDGWKQFNVIESKAGCVRGNHYHKYNSEAFYVISGCFDLRLWKEDKEEIYFITSGMFFSIGPGVFHSFKYVEDTLLISMYSKGVEINETEKDIWNE